MVYIRILKRISCNAIGILEQATYGAQIKYRALANVSLAAEQQKLASSAAFEPSVRGLCGNTPRVPNSRHGCENALPAMGILCH